MSIEGLLTIGIPTYNGGGNLPELLATIKNLGMPEERLEILIIDNGSTDETGSIVEQLKERYTNIHYHKNKSNIGRIENWNKIIQLAEGEFLILMNVNDRFLNFDAGKYLRFLIKHPDIALVMNDVIFENYQYPNWSEDGVLNLSAYIKKTFLDIDYLEFNSLGVLQQHIFRTAVIKKHGILFNPAIPRTTDRVFIAQVIKSLGGNFFYSAEPMVSWRMNCGRFHARVHQNSTNFNFDKLWGDEYKANIEVAKIANIPFPQVLKSQMILASFLMLADFFRKVKSKVLNRAPVDYGLEIPTAYLYYNYLKVIAEKSKISTTYFDINLPAFKRSVIWYLRLMKLTEKKHRTIQDITSKNSSYQML